MDNIHSRCSEQLKTCGLKVTPQRMTVLEAICSTYDHPDAETVYQKVRETLPAISRATVYATLRSLEKVGLVQEVTRTTSGRRFDGCCHDHAHLVCVRCGKIEDLDEAGKEDIIALTHQVTENTAYRVVKSSLNFYGVCPSCQTRK